MSYILDALKHSQDSRGRGAIPDLASQATAVRPEPSRRERAWRLVALITVVVLLAVLAVMGWQRWLTPPPAARLATQPTAQPAAAPAGVAQAPAPAVAAPVAGTAPAQAPHTPPAVSSGATSAPAEAPSESQAPGLEALQQLAGVRVDVDQPPPAAPPAPGAAAAGPPPIVQKLELPVERPPLTAPAAKSPPRVAGAPLREESPAPQLAEYGEVEHWKELPAPIQRQLRETPFNVHIYSSDPKLRFVKSGGRTLREGDAINDELRVLHITRDGVIVGYKGAKYWMRLS